MTTSPPPCCPPDQRRLPTVAVSGFGCVGAIIVGGLASWVWPPRTFHAWLLVLALFAGVFAAKTADRVAVLVTTAAAILVFDGLSTTVGAGVVPVGDLMAYWIPIGFAALLGRGQRWLRPRA
ncbi:hypothetical protein [Virgisporangium aurantiacum]|uniref:Uncharacterized protein n=1 Tax=Virgisporangium aurantiacum TaxID=175570 RepID=A0A8J4E6W7_9ACTN|nr:hypothetical protein [Virgisporangium aurantiacum]GIJ63568.1 hypothetical protein Vau01_110840 [Virgisporangium aurantiacum]